MEEVNVKEEIEEKEVVVWGVHEETAVWAKT